MFDVWWLLLMDFQCSWLLRVVGGFLIVVESCRWFLMVDVLLEFPVVHINKVFQRVEASLTISTEFPQSASGRPSWWVASQRRVAPKALFFEEKLWTTSTNCSTNLWFWWVWWVDLGYVECFEANFGSPSWQETLDKETRLYQEAGATLDSVGQLRFGVRIGSVIYLWHDYVNFLDLAIYSGFTHGYVNCFTRFTRVYYGYL